MNEEESIGIYLNIFQKYNVELKNKLLTDTYTGRSQPYNLKKTMPIVYIVKVQK